LLTVDVDLAAASSSSTRTRTPCGARAASRKRRHQQRVLPLRIDTAGAWSYTASSAHNEFVAGTTYTDSFSVASADGTLTSVTVNILGANRCGRDHRHGD
jgi:VCBS repeat-containing protein